MSERRNVPEIVIAICELLRRSQTRIDLLFTMSEIPHASPKGDPCEVMFSRTTIGVPTIKPSGGARRDRTDDLMLAKHALSQLSYGPIWAVPEGTRTARWMVGLGRLERPTSPLSGVRSNHLSYRPKNVFQRTP